MYESLVETNEVCTPEPLSRGDTYVYHFCTPSYSDPSCIARCEFGGKSAAKRHAGRDISGKQDVDSGPKQ